MGNTFWRNGVRRTRARRTETQQNPSSNYQPPSFTSGLCKTGLEICVETGEYHQSKADAWVSFQSLTGLGGWVVRQGREGFSPSCSKPSERSPSPEKTKNRHYKCLARRKNSISFSDKCFLCLECGPWSYHGSMGEAFLGGSGQYALEFGDVHRPRGHCWIPVGRALKTEKQEPLWHWGQGRKHGRSACSGKGNMAIKGHGVNSGQVSEKGS